MSDIAAIKSAATGRWPGILSTLGGVDSSILDGKHHPCPKCGGTDRFRLLDRDTGALFCNACFDKKCGDGIAALGWLTGQDFKTTTKALGDYLGLRNGNGRTKRKASYHPRTFATTQSLTNAIAIKCGGKLVNTWNYDTFHVLRFDLPTPGGEKSRKEFRPVHQVPLGVEGEMGWQLGYPKPDKNRPLYRLKEIEAAPDDAVVTIHGGEKAADAAAGLGLLATCNAGGEGATSKTDWKPVARFSRVVVTIDNDEAGSKFGRAIATEIKRLNPAAEVKIICLPDLPPKGDIVEWIAAGGMREQFDKLAGEAAAIADEEIESWTKEKISTCKPSAEEGDDPGTIKTLADAICTLGHYARDGGGKLYHYQGGVFQTNGERHIKTMVKSLLTAWGNTKKWSSRLASEVIEFVRVDAPDLPDCPRMDLINLENGMIRVADGVLIPHDPKFLSTVQLPVKHDPAATCQNIEKFVGETFPTDAHSLAWEIPGILMVPATWLQKAILLLGEGANGKSVWLSLLVRFLGKANVSTVSLQRLSNDKFAVARLLGKLANICADLPSDHLSDTSIFKAIVGGDSIPAEYKFKDSFDVVPFARLVFSANHPPRSVDSSAAFFRRWGVIPFDHTFTPEEQIPRDVLDARLQSPEELSGLFNKALEGLRRVQQQQGFSEPASVQAAWQDFHATTDPLAVWLERHTIDDPEVFVTKQILRVAYNAHVEQSGRPAMTAKAFGQAIYRLRPNVDEKQRTVAGKYQWCYIGIGLTTQEVNTQNTRDTRDSSLLSYRTREEENHKEESSRGVKKISGNPVYPVHPVDCPHANVDESPPTHDEHVNRQCRDCGEWLTCRKAEDVA